MLHLSVSTLALARQGSLTADARRKLQHHHRSATPPSNTKTVQTQQAAVMQPTLPKPVIYEQTLRPPLSLLVIRSETAVDELSNTG